LAARQVGHWLHMARAVGDQEVAGWLARVTDVTVRVSEPPEPDRDSPTTAVYELEGDWHGDLAPSFEHTHALREAFYSIACDYTIAYLTWPWYRESSPLSEPLEPYFELWRRGACIQLPSPGQAVVYVEHERKRRGRPTRG
jgi:hypothetical protein